ncbi:MAG: F0F1 ATP synthase subunit A [Bacteroidaceae bacterium]|nr:F0F1 ATP synthase subunit A [Bacteroidaceae bacterium]
MKYLRSITLVLVLALFSTAAFAAANEEKKEGSISLKEILFGHVQDSYQWHLFDIDGHPVVINLPMIFYSEHSGFHVLCSGQFSHHVSPELLREGPDGFYIQGAEDEKGKIVEMVNGSLQPVCFDISITKQVCILFINAIILLLCVLIPARWCKNHKVDDDAPKGFTGLMHMFIMSVYNDLVKSTLGEKADKYAPYLLTCFFFIFFSNLMGVVPFPPGGGNITGNIAITGFLAICTFLITNVTGNKHYWMEIFWPEVPTWLKCPVPLMPVIELFGVFIKPIVLMVRLFANMLAGHAIAISLACIIFIMFGLGGAMGNFLGSFITPVSVLMSIFMMFLELLVCYIQAMVFTLLSAIYIQMSHAHHE